MCIIIYKPEGADLPDAKTLKACFDADPDGAGVMWPQNGTVHIEKGLMTFEALKETLARIPQVREVPVVIHCRIGTQGLNDEGNTHPFPVTSDEKMLNARRSNATVGLAHNGIISLTASYDWYGEGMVVKETHSDTYYFVRDYASLIIEDEKYWQKKTALKLLERLADSKLAIMGKDGHVELIGDFIYDEDLGCWFSNDGYKVPRVLAKTGWKSYTDGWTCLEHGEDTVTYGSVAASFVESGYTIVDEQSGETHSSDDGLFAVDRLESVYIYDDIEDCLRPLQGSVFVTDWTGERVDVFDKTSAIVFEIGAETSVY